ncbi:MAG: N-acetyl-gamma-glutamyl-phosphate reductase [Methanococcaceae archaeon]
MISVGIIGGSGYAGKKLIEFCTRHPFVEGIKVYGNSTQGEKLLAVFPDLMGIAEDSVIGSCNDISYEHDIYFIALPHGEALKYVPAIIGKGKKIIDLGGDYRLDSAALYENWYKLPHTSPALLEKKFYGLADYYCETGYNETGLIANPGCYPTATLLSLLPLVPKFGDDILSVSTVAYSGTSGAGKSAKSELLMSEMFGNVRAYNVNAHRHQAEILQELKKNGFDSPFAFTTHLLPVSTGIYATSTVHLKNSIQAKDILAEYETKYNDALFVRLRNVPPHLTWVTGTNFCDINISIKDNVLIITSAIDNLIKGAAGQAVQNMNKLFSWDEKLGLLKTGEKNV